MRYLGLMAAAAVAFGPFLGEAVEIPARGGVLPNDATADVEITTAGSEGAITLANPETSVRSLLQQSSTPATVELSGGTLTAGKVGIGESGSASLTVGTGSGSLKPLNGGLEFSNTSEDGAVLSVGATLSTVKTDILTKTGPGEVNVGDGFAHTGTLQLDDGTFVVSNATTVTAKLQGDGTFAKAGDVAFRMPAELFKTFTGEIQFRGGTNTFQGNAFLNQSAYHFSFLDGSQIGVDNWYDSATTEIRAEGSGCDGTGVLRVTAASNGRAIPFFTLTGDAAIDAYASSCYIQLGCSSFNPPRYGCLNMNGHRLTKLDGSGRLRLENGEVTNAGEIVLADYTGTYSELSRLELGANYSLGDVGAPAVVLGSRTALVLNGSMRQNRPIKVAGANARISVGSDASRADCYGWKGLEVEEDSDSVEIVSLGSGQRWHLEIDGPLSGVGKVTVGKSGVSDGKGRVEFNGESNTFAGQLEVYGKAASVRLARPDAVSSPDDVTVHGGALALSLNNWTAADIASFLSGVNLTDGGTIGFEVDAAPGATTTLAAASIPAGGYPCVANGGGTVDFVQPDPDEIYRLGAREGLLRIACSEKLRLGNVLVEGAEDGGIPGTILFDGAKDVELHLTNGASFFIGHPTVQSAVPARVVISNSNIQCWSALADYTGTFNNDPYAQSIVVGGASGGILEIGAGAAVTNRLVIGGNTGKPRGAVYMRDGYFCNRGNTDTYGGGVGFGSCAESYGYLELTGGTYEMCGVQCLAAAGGTGILLVDGGATKGSRCVSGNTPSFNFGYVGHSVVEIRKGSLVVSPFNFLSCRSEGSDAVFSIGGTSAKMQTSGVMNCGYAQNTCTLVNMNEGGTLQAPGIVRSKKCSVWPTMHVYVNFNGGTFSYNNSDGFVFGNPDVADDKGGALVDAVTLFEKGATIEVPNKVNGQVFCLSKPVGKGIAAVDATGLDAFTLVGSPRVVIVGSGWGASAYADFDSRTGKVTGIRVTSPGCNYEEGTTASVYYGNTLLVSDLAVTLADNIGGGLTKTGVGTLTLKAANTYAGATTVKAGTLVAEHEASLPAGTELNLAGGVLDLGGHAFALGAVFATSGTFSNGSLSAGGTWTLDCAELAAGGAKTIPDGVVVRPGTQVVFTNTEALEGVKRLPVLSFDPTAVSGTENITAIAPEGWRWSAGTNGAKLVRDVGLMLILR